MTFGYRGPTIDHSLLSLSGHMSKRARDAANKREEARLFPPGFWDKPEPTAEEKAKKRAQQLRLSAQNLRDLAARGMHPRSFPKEAARMEAEADQLDGQGKQEKEAK